MDKYTWQEAGSSFLPGDLIAAFLWAQFEEAEKITQQRLAIWHRYHEALEPLERKGILRRPIIPDDCRYNAHLYYVLLHSRFSRQDVLAEFKRREIGALFHYVPLHSSPAGRRYGRTHGLLAVTDDLSQRLIRLPLWVGLSESQQDRVVAVLEALT